MGRRGNPHDNTGALDDRPRERDVHRDVGAVRAPCAYLLVFMQSFLFSGMFPAEDTVP
jgi:hypothetical protein